MKLQYGNKELNQDLVDFKFWDSKNNKETITWGTYKYLEQLIQMDYTDNFMVKFGDKWLYLESNHNDFASNFPTRLILKDEIK